MRSGAAERDLVVVACAISAGIHAALVPDHLAEATSAGVAFAAAAVLLAVLAGVLTLRPGRAALAAAAALLGGLLAAYALAVTTGLPLVHPDAEPIDGLVLGTKAVELAGLIAAVRLVRPPRLAADRPIPPLLTAMIAVFSALVALSVAGGHTAHGA